MRPDPTLALFAISSGSSIAAWQEQLDWSLRIMAALVAITAGVCAIIKSRVVQRRPKTDLD